MMYFKRIIFLYFFFYAFVLVLGNCSEECSIAIEDSCYRLYSTEENFNEANTKCIADGGEIVSFPDAKTLYSLLNNFNSEDVCHSESSCRFWLEEYSSYPYTNWAPGQEDIYLTHLGRNCMSADFITGKWYRDHCTERFRYICKFTALPCSAKPFGLENADFLYCNEENALYRSNSPITIQCHENFHLIGSPNASCDACGIWSSTPQCLPGCRQPDIPSFASLFNYKDKHFLGDEVIFTCDEGFAVENHPGRSHFIRKCDENGKWGNSGGRCIPIKTRNIENIAVQLGKELILECVTNVNSSEINEKEDWIWQFESHPVESWQGEISPDGKLRIFQVTKQSIGMYVCFTRNPSLEMGQVSYAVMLKSSCEETVAKNEVRYVVENNNFLLNCPHKTSSLLKWLKNGRPIIENSRIVLADDGSLVFYKIMYEDSGVYTCMISDTPLCFRNETTELRVIATAESICGKTSVAQNHPWTVSLWIEEEKAPFCYGTLFHENYVVTSAYCISSFYRKKNLRMFVQFGRQLVDVDELIRIKNSSSQQIIAVESIKIHPKYSRRLFANDIGLLKLKTRVEFSDTIQPICISNEDFTIRHQCDSKSYLQGTVTGWGLLEISNGDNVVLQDESMELLPKSVCENTDTLKFTDDMFCANSNKSIPAIYAADIGSPFEYIHNDKVYLLGIYSLGERATYLGNFDYFTKLSSYVPWIQSYTKI